MKYHLKLQKLLRIEFLEKMINSKNAVKKLGTTQRSRHYS